MLIGYDKMLAKQSFCCIIGYYFLNSPFLFVSRYWLLIEVDFKYLIIIDAVCDLTFMFIYFSTAELETLRNVFLKVSSYIALLRFFPSSFSTFFSRSATTCVV